MSPHNDSIGGIQPKAKRLIRHAVVWSMFLNSSALVPQVSAQAPLQRTPTPVLTANRQGVESLPPLSNSGNSPVPSQAPVAPLPEVMAAPAPQPVRNGMAVISEMPVNSGMPVTGSMTVADFENLAMANNPSLAEAIANVNALRGKWEQVGLAPNPFAGYSDQQLGSPSSEQRGVMVTQEFVRGHKLELNRAVVSQEVQRAQQEYNAQQLRVLTDVRINFANALAAQQRSQLAKEVRTTAQSVVSITQKRLDAKEIGRADLLQAKVEFESALMLLKRSEYQYLESWRKLTATVGVISLGPQPLNGRWDELPPAHEWEPTLQTLLRTSPEIAAAQAEIQRTRWAYQRAQAEKRPNLNFQGIVQDDRGAGATNGALQIILPIPLWNRNQGGVTQAGHEALAAARALEKLELDLQQRLATVFQRYQTAQAQVERYQQSILPDSRENLNLVAKAYHAGEYDYLQMLIAQRMFATTNLAYLEAMQELRIAALEIEGLLLSNSLQASK
jgi:cobalt-zinc-cadmium efflux system outer membrane protein